MATLRCLSRVLWQVNAARLTALAGQPLPLASRAVPVRLMSALSPEFENARTRLGTLKDDPGNEAKLKIYALFKQSTSGAVSTKRPGMTDFVGRAKWDAWKALGSMTQEEAQKAYIDLVNSLVKTEEAAAGELAGPGQKYKYLQVTCEDGLRTITLNRPTKKNAIKADMYPEFRAALEEAASDPKTVITALTGAGDYYCSGNDLSNFTNIDPSDLPQLAKKFEVVIRDFVGGFIDFPKPLVAVVNGPAVGVAVTTLGLFDGVFATDKATFHTPFSSLGQVPEGCASYTFPKMMGYSKASQMLLFDKKVTAQEAYNMHLVTEVYPDATFQKEVWPKLKGYAKLPAKSLIYSKALSRLLEKDILHQTNTAECARLAERWLSEDCINAIVNFFSRKG